MPSLLDLPEELLVSISRIVLPQYPNGRPTLHNLGRVCKRLAPIVRVVIAEHASVHVGKSEEKIVQPEVLIAVTKWLKKYPNLIHCLKHTQLSWEDKRKYKFFNDALKLVAKSISIERLSVEIAVNGQFWNLQMLCDPSAEQFRCLKELDIDTKDGSCLSADSSNRICQLPKLEKLVIDHTSIMSRLVPEGRPPMKGDHPKQPFALKSLTCLSGETHIDLLHCILPHAKSLETLEIALPSPGVRVESKRRGAMTFFNIVSKEVQPFKPKRIENALKPVRSTLKVLSLTNMPMGGYGDYDFYTAFVNPSDHGNSLVDLTSFTKLKRLCISSCLWFGGNISAAAAHMKEPRLIWQLIPTQLSALEIKFEGLQGIFVGLKEVYDRMCESSWDDESVPWWIENVAAAIRDGEQTAWLRGLYEQIEQGKFPLLKSITLHEHWSPGWRFWSEMEIADMLPWPKPEGVRLSVRIIVPWEQSKECLTSLKDMGLSGGSIEP